MSDEPTSQAPAPPPSEQPPPPPQEFQPQALDPEVWAVNYRSGEPDWTKDIEH